MNTEARKNMEKACLTLRQLRENLESASTAVNDQNIKSKIDNQLKNLNSCLEECEHIAGNISQI